MSKLYALDASAMLAVVYTEPGAEIVSRRINDGSAVIVSAVNLCETASKLAGVGWTAAELISGLSLFTDFCVEFGSSQALLAAEIARVSGPWGLSLWDRACLALALSRGATALTADGVWKKLKLDVHVELIR